MNKKTAVEWLESELKKLPFVNVIDVFQQAKEMEKEQIIDAVNATSKNAVYISNRIISAFTKIEGELFMHDENEAEKYFNNTFKKTN